jgi:hypothetical protein
MGKNFKEMRSSDKEILKDSLLQERESKKNFKSENNNSSIL